MKNINKFLALMCCSGANSMFFKSSTRFCNKDMAAKIINKNYSVYHVFGGVVGGGSIVGGAWGFSSVNNDRKSISNAADATTKTLEEVTPKVSKSLSAATNAIPVYEETAQRVATSMEGIAKSSSDISKSANMATLLIGGSAVAATVIFARK